MPFLPESSKMEKVEKLVTNLHDEIEYVIHKKNLKEVLNHRLVLKKAHIVTKFSENAWLNHILI